MTAIYFDSFGIEYILHEVLNWIRDKSITRNIFRLISYDSITRRFYCIAFIEHMFAGKMLLDYADLLSPNDHKKWQNNI